MFFYVRRNERRKLLTKCFEESNANESTASAKRRSSNPEASGHMKRAFGAVSRPLFRAAHQYSSTFPLYGIIQPTSIDKEER
jgi:hypothetical protein